MKIVPLPYATAQEVVDAFNAGEDFLFILHGSPKPVVDIALGRQPGTFRARHPTSNHGDTFKLDGSLSNWSINTRRIMRARDAEAEPAPVKFLVCKPEAGSKSMGEIVKEWVAENFTRPSDKAGIAACPPLPPTPAPVLAVAPTKPADGLLTIANPDDRHQRWGADPQI